MARSKMVKMVEKGQQNGQTWREPSSASMGRGSIHVSPAAIRNSTTKARLNRPNWSNRARRSIGAVEWGGQTERASPAAIRNSTTNARLNRPNWSNHRSNGAVGRGRPNGAGSVATRRPRRPGWTGQTVRVGPAKRCGLDRPNGAGWTGQTVRAWPVSERAARRQRRGGRTAPTGSALGRLSLPLSLSRSLSLPLSRALSLS